MRIHVSNISNTAIINLEQGDGIKKQLGNLTSGQWAWVLSIFYYPYMFLEPLATLALKKFGPRRWMTRIMITWVCRHDGVNDTYTSTHILMLRDDLGYDQYVPSSNAELCWYSSLPILSRGR